jgi:hypothetical protein
MRLDPEILDTLHEQIVEIFQGAQNESFLTQETRQEPLQAPHTSRNIRRKGKTPGTGEASWREEI